MVIGRSYTTFLFLKIRETFFPVVNFLKQTVDQSLIAEHKYENSAPITKTEYQNNCTQEFFNNPCLIIIDTYMVWNATTHHTQRKTEYSCWYGMKTA